jgi:hypothetical protein
MSSLRASVQEVPRRQHQSSSGMWLHDAERGPNGVVKDAAQSPIWRNRICILPIATPARDRCRKSVIKMVAEASLLMGVGCELRQLYAVVAGQEFHQQEVRLLLTFLKLREERLADTEFLGDKRLCEGQVSLRHDRLGLPLARPRILPLRVSLKPGPL